MFLRFPNLLAGLCCILLCCPVLRASAQTRGERHKPYSVTGSLTDAATGKALEYATASLLDSENRAVVSSASHADGKFTLQPPKPGFYQLHISLVGYKPLLKEITLSDTPLDLGRLTLQPGVEIGNVVIEAKTLVKREIDRIVYDVSADPEAGKVKMSDIMLKIPELQPDAGNGKLEYRGMQIAQILIDGMTDEVVNRARQYPMEFIKGDVMKTVELILPGSPEYNNTLPILNIRLARPLPFGVAGEIAGSAATSGDYAPGLDLVTKNKAGVFSASYAFTYKNSPRLWTETQRENLIPESTNRLQNTGTENWNRGKEHKLLFGYSKELFRKKALLQLSASTTGKDADAFNRNTLASLNADGEQIAESETFSKSHQSSPWRFSSGGTLLYRLQNPMSHIRLTYAYTDDRSDRIQQTEAADRSAGGRLQRKNSGYTGSAQHSVELSLHRTLGNGQPGNSKITAEVNYYTRRYDNATHYYLFDDTADDFTEIESQYNGLEYTQQVASGNIGFMRGTRRHKKLMFVAFLRGEYVNSKGTYLSTGNTNLGYREFNLLPRASLVFKPRRTSYRLMYSTRVMRPDVTKLNPYRDESDPDHIRQGNPALRGEYAHRLAATVGRTLTTGFLSYFNLSYNIELTDNAIESYTRINTDNVALTTYGNLGQVVKQEAGTEFSIPVIDIEKPTRSNLDFRLGYSRTTYDFPSEKNVVEGWSGRVAILSLPIGSRGPRLSATYGFSPSYSSAQNKGNSYYTMLDIRLSKYFRRLKLGGQIAISDALHGRRFVKETTGSETFLMHARRERQGRIFTFSLYWRFGRFRDGDRATGVSGQTYDLSRPGF